jgi:cyclopropane fatty-acyl-phospholipid synthase-like methyltransferase
MKIYDTNSIIEEYSLANKYSEEYKKAKWGSQDGMINRFKLVINLVNFEKISNWLDIGCGTGCLFNLALEKHPKIKALGIDICPEMIQYANKKKLKPSIKFKLEDFSTSSYKYNFDLITSIGVLQKTNLKPKAFFQTISTSLKPEGKFFITTKNLYWDKFTSGEFVPENLHNWFIPEEIIKLVKNSGLNILEIKGFLPKENLIVDINQSHTFYIYGEKTL